MVRSCDEEFIRIHITKQYKDTIVDLIYIYVLRELLADHAFL